MLNSKKIRPAAAAAAAAALLLGACTDTLTVASHARLASVDPISTTAYVTRSHGYLVYDTLFALDENFEPQPQMVGEWTVSEDQRLWSFTLRDGLKWHDGTDVTAEDCVASLERWSKRDGMGQQLFKNVVSLTAMDAKTFTMTLRQPSDLVLPSLAKLSAQVPFMMPKRIAETDAMTEIEDTVGSGPFIFKQDESGPDRAVYLRNPAYVPRSEEPSLAAGGKVVEVDRLVWQYFPNQADAVQAIIDGKVDYVESPSTQLVPLLEGRDDVTVASTDPLGNMAMARFNHLQPPFNNPAIRRAVLMAMSQEEYMTAALGDRRYWRTCYSVYPCGTTFASDTGSESMQAYDLDAARRALQAAGYNNEPVVLLNPTDTPVMAALTEVTAKNLRSIGMNVQVQDMDWATLLERRQDRGPASAGGWSMFHTWWIAADVYDPLAIAFSGDPESGWFGWASDPRLEELRAAFATADNPAERQNLATRVQQRLWEIAAFGELGQFYEPVAFRSALTGTTSPMQFYWGVSLAD